MMHPAVADKVLINKLDYMLWSLGPLADAHLLVVAECSAQAAPTGYGLLVRKLVALCRQAAGVDQDVCVRCRQ